MKIRTVGAGILAVAAAMRGWRERTSEFHATNAGRIIDDFLAGISGSSGGGAES
jgi:hypothetical protein